MPLGESGWVWVGAASWPAGLPDGAGLTGLRRTRPCRTLRRRAKGGRAASSLTPSEILKSQRQAALSLPRAKNERGPENKKSSAGRHGRPARTPSLVQKLRDALLEQGDQFGLHEFILVGNAEDD
jgi:hypothetical protein